MKVVDFKKKDEEKVIPQLVNEDSKLYDEPKGMMVFYKAVFGFSITSIGAAILMAFGIPVGISYLISVPILFPASLVGINVLKKKMDRSFNVDMQMSQQILKMFVEVDEADHKIEKNTSCFYHEITKRESLTDADADMINNINQFLYMINENYYEEIIKRNPNMRRDELIDKILDQIEIYVEKFGIHEFTINEATSTINGCIFIDDDVKKQIIKEFKQSEYRLFGKKHYQVLSKNLDSQKNFDNCLKEMGEELHSREHYLKLFNVEDIRCYEILLESSDESPGEFRKNFGSFSDVEWDLEALRDVMAFMLTKFSKEFRDIKGEYFNVSVVGSFMCNVFTYAKLNNTGRVGIYEIIQTFKNWDFFSGFFDLRLEVIDAIFEKFDLDYSMHPFREKKKETKENKILSFPKAIK